jgi:hypothetical protein
VFYGEAYAALEEDKDEAAPDLDELLDQIDQPTPSH